MNMCRYRRMAAYIIVVAISWVFINAGVAWADEADESAPTALDVGIRIGVTRVTLSEFVDLDPGANIASAMGISVRVRPAALLRLGVPPWLSAQADLVYGARGARILSRATGNEEGGYDLTYLAMPLLVRADRSLATRLTGHLLVGPSIGIPLESTVEDINGTVDFMEFTNSVDIGLIAGAGVSVDVLPNISVSLDVRYEHGLLDIYDTGNDVITQHRIVSLNLGVAWSTGRDSDRDGMVNDRDHCWSAAEDRDGYKDMDGCPDPDNDADGVLDAADNCPDEAEDADGFEDANGCPDPDNDADGVPDTDDKCPLKPFDTADGCPPTYQWIAEVGAERIVLKAPIDGFVQGQAILTDQHRAILADIVTMLGDYPAIRLRILGHADGEGSTRTNERVSQARADAIRDHLISAGVAADRLVSKGMGESKPIRQEDTEAGKQKNRRAEFEVIPETATPGDEGE